jgi:hypothetical protein
MRDRGTAASDLGQHRHRRLPSINVVPVGARAVGGRLATRCRRVSASPNDIEQLHVVLGRVRAYAARAARS